MNQTTLTNAASVAAEKSKNIIVAQIDKQAHALGASVSQTAKDLEQVGAQLRQSDTINSAAQLADWAAGYVSTAGTYLSSGTTDSFIKDLETFSRERPWAIAATAAALGLAASRVVKSSSVRRYNSSDYVETYPADSSFESSARTQSSAADLM